MEARIDNGMEMKMMTVLRQLPRNSRIIRPVRQAAMVASRTTPEIEARTKNRLIPDRLNLQRLAGLRANLRQLRLGRL